MDSSEVTPQDRAAQYNSAERGPLIEQMGIQFTSVAASLTSATMPVKGNTQPYGLLHGGASAVLAETVGSVAAVEHAGAGRVAVGIELNCTHHRGARQGVVTGTARALRLGGSLASYAIDILDEDGALVCTSRLTCIIRDRAPGATQQ